MILTPRPGNRAAVLLFITAMLLSACAQGPQAAATSPTIQAPGTITTHMDGRADFFMGVASSK
jgi:hypothetical protein